MTRKADGVRDALQAASRVYDALKRAAMPGAAEHALERAVLEAAGEHEVRYDLLTGPRTADIEGGATDRVLAAGDAVLLDLCLRSGEYWCDVCRTYFLGSPPEDALQTYEKLHTCVRFAAGLLRPGAAAAALYGAVETYFRDNGLQGCLKHHTGHGIGLTPFEAPVETATSGDFLKEGDVVTVEIGAYFKGRYGIRLEDDYLVTAQGAVLLWEYPMALQNAIL